ncbi:hypothetical protein G5714_014193 [Onychostoma macrolepis]|uniref:Uncharacterized protein n=1 Tax=Onychostoma macrolepis TaxID=369639 RepID=A0A7J6CGM1_9TELE|nr:hypothetical protein G5714_014193 [Onychostoma macrolepis]
MLACKINSSHAEPLKTSFTSTIKTTNTILSIILHLRFTVYSSHSKMDRSKFETSSGKFRHPVQFQPPTVEEKQQAISKSGPRPRLCPSRSCAASLLGSTRCHSSFRHCAAHYIAY